MSLLAIQMLADRALRSRVATQLATGAARLAASVRRRVSYDVAAAAVPLPASSRTGRRGNGRKVRVHVDVGQVILE